MQTKTKVYALFIGINEYNYPIRKLRGCENDTIAIREHLDSDSSIDLISSSILNKDATKSNIVQSIKTHLGQAKTGDVALLYYSGHGTEEDADPEIWTNEANHRLQCLVCYNETDDGYLLADKELRYLIHQLNDKDEAPEVLTIFDCCHSGDNTRNAFLQSSEERLEKRIGKVFQQREWSDFIFADKNKRADVIGKPVSSFLPEGIHTQLAACADNESAWEASGEGQFTKHLIQTLKATNNNISYHDLISRVQLLVQNTFQQTPQLYIPGKNRHQLYLNFLNKKSNPEGFKVNMVPTESGTWKLDVGGLQGVSEILKEVEVFDIDGKKVADAEIISINQNNTIVRALTSLDRSKIYFASLKNFMSKEISFFIVDEDGLYEDLEKEISAVINSEESGHIYLSEKEETANYVIRLWDGKVTFTYPFDRYRPLVLHIDTEDINAIDYIQDYLKKISKWDYSKSIRHVDKEILVDGEFPIDITIKHGEYGKMDLSRNVINIGKDHSGRGYFNINLKNKSKKELYVAVLYFYLPFGCMTKLIRTEVQRLESGNDVDLQGFNDNAPDNIAYTLSNFIIDYNWEQSKSSIKVIVSNTDFQVGSFQMHSLSAPYNYHDIIIDKLGQVRNFDTGEKSIGRIKAKEAWAFRDIDIVFNNPYFKQIPKSKERLEELLNNKNTDKYALAHFFDLDHLGTEVQPNFEETDEVGVRALESTPLWGPILSVANAAAKRWRRRKYNRMARKYPTKIKMVSEGDSWFQHPMIKETIDHLMKYYPIYSVGKAGQELSNYVASGEFNKALEEIKPKYFLISGGGNDILGENMKKFLHRYENVDICDEGLEPGRFFNDNFKRTIEQIEKWYQIILDASINQDANMKIIIHGYDYIIPRKHFTNLSEKGAKKGWVGRFLSEFGITREGDRKAISKYLIDTFNTRIIALINDKKYHGKVYFADVRDNVLNYEWYDEIHPDDNGFLKISGEFLQIINAIEAKKV